MPGGSSSCCFLCSHWSLMYCISTSRASGWSSSISMVVRTFVPALTLLCFLSYNSSCSSSSDFWAALGVSLLCVGSLRWRWLALSHMLGSWVARCCCMILTFPVPGLGLRGSEGGGLGGCHGLWGWRTLWSSSGVVNLPALVLLLVWIFLSLSPAVPKVVWRP